MSLPAPVGSVGSTGTFSRPDWVLLGIQRPDGTVMVLGSTSLSEAELRVQADLFEDPFDPFRVVPAPSRNTLTAQFRQGAMAIGRTYAEAIRTLFDTFDPDQRPAIGP